MKVVRIRTNYEGGTMLNKLKVFIKNHPILMGLLLSICTTFIGTAILYTYIPKSVPTMDTTGSIQVIKDYFIAGTEGNINKRVYILVDKNTKLLYMQIDTLQDNKVVASSQSELYNEKQQIMSYKDYLSNEGIIQPENANLNNKVQMIKPVEPSINSEGKK